MNHPLLGMMMAIVEEDTLQRTPVHILKRNRK
jgi:hypothetical protein